MLARDCLADKNEGAAREERSLSAQIRHLVRLGLRSNSSEETTDAG